MVRRSIFVIRGRISQFDFAAVHRNHCLEPKEGCMNQTRKESSAISHDSISAKDKEAFVLEFHGVRYQVKDVSRSVAFYTKQLGFKLDMQQLPAFANVSLGNLKLLLSGPAAS